MRAAEPHVHSALSAVTTFGQLALAASGVSMLVGVAVTASIAVAYPLRSGFPTPDLLGPGRTSAVRASLRMFWYGLLGMFLFGALVEASQPGANLLLIAAELCAIYGIMSILDAERHWRIDGDTIGMPRWPEKSCITTRYSHSGILIRMRGLFFWCIGTVAHLGLSQLP
jgi:hypothetical protein